MNWDFFQQFFILTPNSNPAHVYPVPLGTLYTIVFHDFALKFGELNACVCVFLIHPNRTTLEANMEIGLRTVLLPVQGVDAVSCVGDVALISRLVDGKRVLNIAEHQAGLWKTHTPAEGDAVADNDESCYSFGSHFVLGSRAQLVFASVSDGKKVGLFKRKEQDVCSEPEAVEALGFQNPLCSLKAFPNGTGYDASDVVAAVSTTGEVKLLCFSESTGEISSCSLAPLGIERVLFVSKFQDKYLVVLGTKDGKIVLQALEVGCGKNIGTFKAEPPLETILPSPPDAVTTFMSEGKSAVLGFILEEEYAFVLYQGGYIHIMTADIKKKGSSKAFPGAWFNKSAETIPNSPQENIILRHAFQLLPDLSEKKASSSSLDGNNEDLRMSGGIVGLKGGYVAVGFGHYLSVWDGVYNVGHGLLHTRESIETLFEGVSSARVFVACGSSLKELIIGNGKRIVSLSLGLTVKRKGTCDEIISNMLLDSESAPLHAQPVTVGPIKAAAEAGGNTNRLFRRVMESENNEETHMVRQLLSRSRTPSAESVSLLTKEYTSKLRKVRRGNFGKTSNLGLAKLPSERLAAVTVARCLYEIHNGNLKFLVPMIDMIGTGVVSSEASLAVIAVSDSWDMGPNSRPLSLTSIIDPLTVSDNYLNVIEAIVGRVADLPERDMVRIMQFAGRLCEVNTKKSARESGSMDETAQNNEILTAVRLARSKRLLKSCMTCTADRFLVIPALKKVPFTDVIALLHLFEEILGTEQVGLQENEEEIIPDVPSKVRLGYFSEETFSEDSAIMYRGLRNWLDKDLAVRSGSGNRGQEQGCIEWTCHVVDAHLADLILDNSARELMDRLLETVRQKRKESELLKGIEGLMCHLVDMKAIPNEEDSVYKMNVRLVPPFAALM